MNTPEHLPQNIILCGFMGTGKSSVGRILAQHLGWQFMDTDALIEQREGRTVSAIFAKDGEAKFRDLESAVAAELVNYQHTVVATGGGIVLHPENRVSLERAGLVVCLDAPAEEISRRLAQFTDRPLLTGADPAARIAELLAQRKESYGAIKQHVDTAARTAEQVADAILMVVHDRIVTSDGVAMKRAVQRIQTVDGIRQITFIEAIRSRPAMWVNVPSHAIYNMLYAVLDDPLNQIMAGLCKGVEIILHSDSSVTISDKGIGIPVGIEPQTGISLLERDLTQYTTPLRRRDYSVYGAGGGIYGIGLIPINALSEWLIVEVRRDGFVWRQSYARGERTSDVVKVRPMANSELTGTTITFYPDAEIFDGVRKAYDYSYEIVAHRCRQLAYLLSSATFRLVDERVRPFPLETTFFFERGLEEYVEYLNRDCTPLHAPVNGKRIFQLDKGQPTHRTVEVEFAFQYTEDSHITELGFVNTVQLLDGGTHLTGLHAALTRIMNRWLRRSISSKDNERKLIGRDTRKGLTAVISLKHPYPRFENAIKLRLDNPEVRGMVESTVASVFADYLERNPEDAQRIVENCRRMARIV